jgi:zinc D-Ala-D-Ala carboxypeptidase
LLGSDDFSFKVSPDGSAYHNAILIDRTSGRVELPKPAILPAASSAPAAPARAIGFKGFGFYPRSGFIHIDLGPSRSWGERFPKRATAFAGETPPAREVLAESRTLKGGGAAGVATVGAAGVEVAQQVLAETQGAVLPLVPYLDTLRWLFIAVALGGIAVAIYARLDDWKRGRR